MPTTIRDIAKKLNLSIAAVSRALDGYPDISAETRRRVQETAREMGYAPNQAARQLRRRRADAIGYILPVNTPRFSDPFYSEFIAGLGDEAARQQLDLVTSAAPAEQEAEQRMYQKWVQGNRVDGIVLNRIRLQDWRVQYLAQAGFPFVGLEMSRDGVDYPCVCVETDHSLADLVKHVAARGFRRMAFIGGEPSLVLQAARLDAFRRGLTDAGLEFDPALLETTDLSASGGYQAAKRLGWSIHPPDALICINDEVAFGALHAVRELGLAAGRDIAVTGFDGVQNSAFSDPPLTTIDQPVYDIAVLLVKMLGAEINHQPLAERQVVIQPEFRLRASA